MDVGTVQQFLSSGCRILYCQDCAEIPGCDLNKSLGVISIAAMVLVAWLLWQGAAYWWLKLRAIRTHSDIAPRYLGWFSIFKTVNWILIGLLPLFVLARLLGGAAFSSGVDVIVSLGFYILAILEQVNYYHYQLMYDMAADWQYLMTHKRLKPSKLSQDLGK
jgi:hypothetical protein